MMHVCLTHACACAALWLKPIAFCLSNLPFSSKSNFAQAMSQNRKDEATSSEDVEQEDYRSYTWKCDLCEKVKYTKQIAADWSEGLSPRTVICRECLQKIIQKNIEEYEEKKPKKKRRMRARKRRMQTWIVTGSFVTESFACLVQFY